MSEFPLIPDPAAEEIIHSVERNFDVTRSAIFSVRKPSELVYARAAAMYFVHKRLGWAITRLGTYFGRDRNSVRHALRMANGTYREDPAFRRRMVLVRKDLDARDALTAKRAASTALHDSTTEADATRSNAIVSHLASMTTPEGK